MGQNGFRVEEYKLAQGGYLVLSVVQRKWQQMESLIAPGYYCI